LKSESANLKSEYDAISASIRQYINGIVCDEDDVLSIKARNAKSGMCSTEETLELLSTLIENDRIEEEKLEDEQNKIDKALEEITATLTNHKTWSDARRSLEKSKSDLAEAIATLEILKVKLQSEEANKPKVEDIRKQIAAIEAEIPEYQELDNKIKERDTLQKITDKLSDELNTAKVKLESLKKEMEDFSEERKTLDLKNLKAIKKINI
jgi:exonuclease SbcC